MSTSVRTIPWWQPHIGPKEYRLVKKVFESGFLNEGEITAELENKLATILNAKYVVACTSGTSALFLALKACGIGPGDEVLVPDLTFIATANAVRLTGASVVLVDIDTKTLTIDPEDAKRRVTARTKAIVPVHVSGRAAHMCDILSLARNYNLAVIEDAAEALGSNFGKSSLGTLGNAGCFSFTANKMITCGQGGAVATNDRSVYEKLRLLKNHGRPKKGTGGDDIHKQWGFNFKLTNVQAAILLGQFELLPQRLEKLCTIYQAYQELLKDVKQIHLLPFAIGDGERPLWVDAVAEDRDSLLTHLAEKHIETRKFWFPIHTQQPYKESSRKFPNSTRFSKQAFWLPSSFLMSDNDVQYVCNHIKEYYRVHE